MTRIDHAVEARRLMTQALTYSESPGAIVDMLAAQTAATLALVEQQRIGNLIALAEWSRREWGNYAGEAGGMGTLLSHPEPPGGNCRVRDDIAAALGIGEYQ